MTRTVAWMREIDEQRLLRCAQDDNTGGNDDALDSDNAGGNFNAGGNDFKFVALA